jgi:hypothetical protein
LSSGTGVTFNGSTGEISIGQDVGTSDNVSFANVNISGDLNVTGTQTTVTSETLAVTDPLIRLAESNEQTDVIDIGFIGHYYGEGSRRHTGFFRDASNKEYYIFNGLIDSAFDSSPPTNIVDRTKPGFTLATLNTGRIVGVYAGFDSDLGTKTTSDLDEGTNLYYTKVRVDSDIALKVDTTFVDNLAVNYSSLTGTPVFGSGLTDQSGTIIIGPDQVKATMIDFGAGANQVSTDDVLEGSSNLYYTDAKVATYVDAAYVQGKIDQSFIDTFDTHDSVAVLGQINATVNQSFINQFDTHDSTAIANQARDVINTNVTQSFINALNIDADTLDGQDGTYYLNYNNLTNAPTVLDSLNVTSIINETDTHDSAAVQGQIDANFASGFTVGGDLSGGIQSKFGGFYAPQNPEGTHFKGHAFFNDIAYARLRGSTISVDVDGTAMTSTTNIDNMLSPNNNVWNMSTSGVTTVTITITSIPSPIQFGSYMGVNFISKNFRAKDITLEYSQDSGFSWSTAGTFTDQGDEFVVSSFNSGNINTNALRWTLEDFNAPQMRINGLFAYDFNSPGMSGLYLPLGGGNVYGDIGVTGEVSATSFSGDGSSLTGIAGAKGGSTDQVFYENDQTVTANYTITTNKNAMTAGPITIDAGVTVTIPTGSEWSIV